ncbi:PREDICTED: NAD-dependent protein deacylase sirtuin-5, mitochondrial [Aptenodytes forsteri]|nr:PREDICTED: NAD-dependent protein deacylase sirtuin-5, mitochondrial [Aptenodytes forsteri]
MSLFQFTARRLVSQAYCGLKAASSSKKQKFCLEMARPSSNMADFREVFAKAKHIAIITGAGVSAESGVPTFRGAGGFWRKWQAQELATPEAFARNPSRVWEFYHYRREVMLSKHPNPAHIAIAECERRLSKQGRSVVVITQNIDELHRKAGTKHLLEIHGSLFKTRCTNCGNVAANYKSPICPALAGKGAPDPETEDATIPVEDLPQCEEDGCNGLLRPHVVWFGETLDPDILTEVEKELEICDLCLVVGTSSVVYPAAMFAPQVSARGVPVAEFNMEATPATNRFRFHFPGPCGTTLPPALARPQTEMSSKRKLLPEAVLQELAAAPPARPDGQAAAANRGKRRGGGAPKQRQGQVQRRLKKDEQRKGARSKGNYTAVCLKDQSLTGLHQQLAKDFLNTHLYGPDTNRAQANEFFSLENKKNPVKKAAVQFVDKSWGQEKKQRAARFKKRWLSTQIKN